LFQITLIPIEVRIKISIYFLESQAGAEQSQAGAEQSQAGAMLESSQSHAGIKPEPCWNQARSMPASILFQVRDNSMPCSYKKVPTFKHCFS